MRKARVQKINPDGTFGLVVEYAVVQEGTRPDGAEFLVLHDRTQGSEFRWEASRRSLDHGAQVLYWYDEKQNRYIVELSPEPPILPPFEKRKIRLLSFQSVREHLLYSKEEIHDRFIIHLADSMLQELPGFEESIYNCFSECFEAVAEAIDRLTDPQDETEEQE